MRYLSFILFFFFFVGDCAYAQDSIATQFLDRGYGYMEYSGRLYNEDLNESAHPYLYDAAFHLSDVFYFGRRYSNVMLSYDIVSDKVVTLYTDGITRISLIPEQVDSFFLLKNWFIRLHKSPDLEGGFYLRLYTGRQCTIYAKHTKKIAPDRFVNGAERDLVYENTAYYFEADGKFTRIHSPATIGSLLHVSQKTAKKFAAQHLRADTDESYIAAAQFFDPK